MGIFLPGGDGALRGIGARIAGYSGGEPRQICGWLQELAAQNFPECAGRVPAMATKGKAELGVPNGDPLTRWEGRGYRPPYKI